MLQGKARRQLGAVTIFIFTFSDMISRQDQSLQVLIPNVDNQEDFQNLVSLVYKHGAYWMFHSKSLNDDSFKNHADRVWKIVKYECYNNNKLNTVELQEDDVIKFGRVRFKIKKLVIDPDLIVGDDENFEGVGVMTSIENEVGPANPGTEPETRLSTFQFTQGIEQAGFEMKPAIVNEEAEKNELKLKNQMETLMKQKTGNTDILICRICLSEEEQDNPLISPCNCTGSMKNIHLECLKEWLEGKKHMKETPVVNSYIWKNLECEICKATYTDSYILKNGKEVSLLNYNVHENAKMFMILASVTSTTSLTIHVVNFSERRKIKVGRGQNAEVRITDISVSRIHSQIRLNKKGQVFIEDNSSKFGTLVQLKDPQVIKSLTPTYVQIGRAVLVLYTTNRYSCLESCFKSAMSKKKDNAIHYDEVQKEFPSEFQELFQMYEPRKPRSINSLQNRDPIIENSDSRENTQTILNNNRNAAQRYEANEINIISSPEIRQEQRNHAFGHRNSSLAIEFNTNPDRLDSEIVNTQQRRDIVINGLVQGMERTRADSNQVQMLRSQNDYQSQEYEILPAQHQPLFEDRTFSRVGNQPLDIVQEEDKQSEHNPLEHSNQSSHVQIRHDELENSQNQNVVIPQQEVSQEQNNDQVTKVQQLQHFQLQNINDYSFELNAPNRGRVHLLEQLQSNNGNSIFEVSKQDRTAQELKIQESTNQIEEIKIREFYEEDEGFENKFRKRDVSRGIRGNVSVASSAQKGFGSSIVTQSNQVNDKAQNQQELSDGKVVSNISVVNYDLMDSQKKKKPQVEADFKQLKEKQRTNRESKDYSYNNTQ